MPPENDRTPIPQMELEVDLLEGLRPHLRSDSVVDVGGLDGVFSAVLRETGWSSSKVIEAFPQTAAELRDRFAGDPEVEVIELAAAAEAGTLTFHEVKVEGRPEPGLSTARPREVEGFSFEPKAEVEARPLNDLAADGLIPSEPGLLKVDAEGMELEVVQGASGLRPELMLVEHWVDLPHHGPCPWSFSGMSDAAAALGLTGSISIEHWTETRHGREYSRILPGCDPAPGDWANLLFFAPHLTGAVADVASELERSREAGLLARLEQLQEAADQRLERLERADAGLTEARAALEALRAERKGLIDSLNRRSARARVKQLLRR